MGDQPLTANVKFEQVIYGDRLLTANVEFEQVKYGRSAINCER